MKSENMAKIFQTIIFVLFLTAISTSLPFYQLNGVADIGRGKVSVQANDVLKVTTTWQVTTIPLQLEFQFASASDLTTSGTGRVVLQYTSPTAQDIQIHHHQDRNFIGPFRSVRQLNGKVISAISGLFFYENANAFKFNVQNTCSFTVSKFGGGDGSAYIELFKPYQQFQLQSSDYSFGSGDLPQTINVRSNQIGQWHIAVYTGNSDDNEPFSVTISTECSNLCTSPLNINQRIICRQVCGDGIRTEKQTCDNGNKTGCSNNCQPDQNYKCTGIVGSTSYCLKDPICGDKVVDSGEECDNGNLIGCSANCKVDLGFKCASVPGKTSLCSQCGNGILEYGQQCDNRNQLGCTVGCKVDVGFECRLNICSRKNPVCSNGIIQIAEGCDDGNSLSNDGCSNFCRVELGYICKGELGDISKCSKQLLTCGNGIFQLPSSSSGLIQQCDNGNQEGCRGCVIEKDWKCSSIVGQRSNCYLDISVPSCGNGVYEIWKGEQCDDGNIYNGDGCNNRCAIEFGWSCPNGVQCSRNSTPPPEQRKSFCGNGIVEPPWQDCDNGFPLQNKNGCSINCKFLK